jgi:hypothetical protein
MTKSAAMENFMAPFSRCLRARSRAKANGSGRETRPLSAVEITFCGIGVVSQGRCQFPVTHGAMSIRLFLLNKFGGRAWDRTRDPLGVNVETWCIALFPTVLAEMVI